MDALDIRILREMGPLPYGRKPQGPDALKPAHIARAIGATPETVRDRIARLEASGVIAGYDVIPNLGHLGLTASSFLCVAADDERRASVGKQLDLVEGVLEATFFLGREVCIDLSFRTKGERERRVRMLAEITGDPEPKPFLGWTMPPVPRPLKILDWRIIRALRGNAKRPLADLASELGLSYRTVRRHYDQMMKEGSLFTKPLVNPAQEPGLIPAVLLFFFGPAANAETVNRIVRDFDDDLVLAQTPLSPDCGSMDLVLFASSAAELERMRTRAAAIPGVARVQALIPTDVVGHAAWLDEWIDAHARGAPV